MTPDEKKAIDLSIKKLLFLSNEQLDKELYLQEFKNAKLNDNPNTHFKIFDDGYEKAYSFSKTKDISSKFSDMCYRCRHIAELAAQRIIELDKNFPHFAVWCIARNPWEDPVDSNKIKYVDRLLSFYLNQAPFSREDYMKYKDSFDYLYYSIRSILNTEDDSYELDMKLARKIISFFHDLSYHHEQNLGKEWQEGGGEWDCVLLQVLGQAYLRIGLADSAIKHLKDCAEKFELNVYTSDPISGEYYADWVDIDKVYKYLGEAHQLKNRRNEARKYFSKMHLEIGTNQQFQKNNLFEAIKEYKLAYGLDNENIDALLTLGDIIFDKKTNSLSEAIEKMTIDYSEAKVIFTHYMRINEARNTKLKKLLEELNEKKEIDELISKDKKKDNMLKEAYSKAKEELKKCCGDVWNLFENHTRENLENGDYQRELHKKERQEPNYAFNHSCSMYCNAVKKEIIAKIFLPFRRARKRKNLAGQGFSQKCPFWYFLNERTDELTLGQLSKILNNCSQNLDGDYTALKSFIKQKTKESIILTDKFLDFISRLTEVRNGIEHKGKRIDWEELEKCRNLVLGNKNKDEGLLIQFVSDF